MSVRCAPTSPVRLKLKENSQKELPLSTRIDCVIPAYMVTHESRIFFRDVFAKIFWTSFAKLKCLPSLIF